MDSEIHFNLLILALLTSILYLLYIQSKNETLGYVPDKSSICIPHSYLTVFLIPCGVLAAP